jgi:hypothetical protein
MLEVGTVLILLGRDEEGRPKILESVSDDPEILLVEEALAEHHPDPVMAVRQRRQEQENEEEAFADYIETLLSAATCGIQIQRHAALWFRSRIDLEEYRRAEIEARRVIVDFAFRLYCEDPSQTDFTLAAPHAEVRILIRDLAILPVRTPAVA